MAAVIEAVQELGRQEEVFPLELPLYGAVPLVVIGIHVVVNSPGVQDAPLLQVVLREVVVGLRVPSPFVGVVPKEDTGVHLIPLDHLGDQPFGRLRVVRRLLPARQFVQHVQAQFVAGFEEMDVRRVVGHAHRVHVHFLEQPRIHVALLATHGSAGIGEEAVTVHPLQADPRAVEEETFAGPDLERSEAEPPCRFMKDRIPVAQLKLHGVEVWRFGGPQRGPVDSRLQSHLRPVPLGDGGGRAADLPALAVEDPSDDPVRALDVFQIDVQPELPIRLRVDGSPVDELRGESFEVDGPVDSAEDPVIAFALRQLD